MSLARSRRDSFIDIDAFIMNPAFKLEWLLDVAEQQQQTGGVDGWGELAARTARRRCYIITIDCFFYCSYGWLLPSL